MSITDWRGITAQQHTLLSISCWITWVYQRVSVHPVITPIMCFCQQAMILSICPSICVDATTTSRLSAGLQDPEASESCPVCTSNNAHKASNWRHIWGWARCLHRTSPDTTNTAFTAGLFGLDGWTVPHVLASVHMCVSACVRCWVSGSSNQQTINKLTYWPPVT